MPQHQVVMRTPKDLARTWDALGGALEVSPRRLHEWRQQPGAPKTKSISEWQEWIDENKSDKPSDDDAGDSDLKRQKLEQEIRKLRINNDLKEQVMVSEAKQAAQDLLIAAGKRLRSVMLGLLPSRLAKGSVGKTGPEIETLARELIEAALQESRL